MTRALKIYQKFENSIAYLFSNNSDEKKFLRKIFKKKKVTILDAGCNVGTFIDLVDEHLNIKNIYAFEPSKTCYIYLKNKYKNKKIKIYNLALSNKSKNQKFYEKEITSQSSFYREKSLVFKKLRNISTYNINCISIDQFNKKNKNIYHIVKIDCEGEDLNIIKGAKNLLKNNLIKLLKVELKFTENNFYEIINYLNKYKYKLVTITKVKFNKYEAIDHLDAYFEKK